MRNALREEDEEGEEGHPVCPLCLPTDDLMRGGGGGARRPGARRPGASSVGLSGDGAGVEISRWRTGKRFSLQFSPHSRQMTNSR